MKQRFWLHGFQGTTKSADVAALVSRSHQRGKTDGVCAMDTDMTRYHHEKASGFVHAFILPIMFDKE